MSRLEFLILSILECNNAISKFSGMAVSEILAAEELGYKENTCYKQLKDFSKQGLVRIGAKEGRALTFFITHEGIKKLMEERENEK
jgi:DNA-binding MarR family transcriptional regulator